MPSDAEGLRTVTAAQAILKWVAVCVVVVGASVILFKFVYPTYTYRYRLTVAISVGGEVHSGSSVIEVSTGRRPKILPDTASVSETVRGEAVLVDLGTGWKVLALLASGRNAEHPDYPAHIIPRVFNLNVLQDGVLAQLPSLRGRRALEQRDFPTFVATRNPSDPRSVTELQPSQFGEVIGAGVALQAVTVELTTDPVTTGIGDQLPWVGAGVRSGLGATRSGYSNRYNVNIPDFIRS